ncbi:MAG: dTMP kinase [Candidatus Aenigmarchaeota archaeon]|nr:dTMP kinase [Candidatus Aenigmarchaeota archaeon]
MVNLIAFEGLDGSGLSTQAIMLKKYLASRVKSAVLTKEPTDGLIGGMVKASLRREWKTNPLTLQLLFAADRSHHLSNDIEPAIKKSRIVITDRYVLSSLAFGSIDVNMNFLKQLNAPFRRPDITFLIDTQPKICLQRMKNSRFHFELFEDEQRLQTVRSNYISLKNYFTGTFIIDGNKKPDEVFNEIRRIIDKKIF